MNQTAMLMNMVPVAGVREGIAAGQKATWARAPDDATQEAALAFALVGRLLPAASLIGSPVVDSHEATRNELAQWLGKLESLSKLAPGWNRQGAPAPSENAIRAARLFIEALVNDGQPPTRIAASAVGGVGVTRNAGERMAYVEFYNDGGACALLAEDEGDERVLDIAPERGTFRDLLDEVRAYLNG